MTGPPFASAVGGFCLILLLLAATDLAFGDVVLLEDGRRFEGKIVQETSSFVRIDTLVSGIRVTLRLYRFDIKELDQKPLPAGFFDKEEKPDPRLSKPGASGTEYIEVPIVGRFGTQVVATGIKRCLSYAATHGIRHVVFRVDSHGGDQIAASEIYDLLAKYDERLTYHAVVRDAVGVAMAVPVFCDNVFLKPGANLGGVHLSLEGRSGDPDVVLSQIAYDASVVAGRHGWSPDLVRAMIDPEMTVVAWRTPVGNVETGSRAPRDATLLLEDGSESLLTLTRSQALELGQARAFTGAAAEIGAALGLEGWRLESDYGKRAMADAARKEQRLLAKRAARHEKKIKKYIKRRELAQRYIERALDLANEFDTELTTYGTYKDDYGRWDGYWGSWGRQRSTITRTQWRKMIDNTTNALSHARRGVRQMKKLDREAVALGLEPTYEPGSLDTIEDDIVVKIRLLLSRRKTPGSTGEER